MQLHPARLAVAAATLLAAAGSVVAVHAGAGSAADQPVSRFTAYQACQAAMWRWTAENASAGTTVSGFRHAYRPQDVWREHGGWHVLVGGKRGEPVTASSRVEQCVVGGTNARPRLVSWTFPR